MGRRSKLINRHKLTENVHEVEIRGVCGKVTYPTLRDAQTKRNWILAGRGRGRTRRRKVPAFLRVYRCQICHGWHLSHVPERLPPEFLPENSA